MSFGEELRRLDNNRIGDAIGSSVIKIMQQPEGIADLVRHMRGAYPKLGVLPDAIARVIRSMGGPAFPESETEAMRTGAILLAVVFSEYAHLEELEDRFPDIAGGSGPTPT